MTPEAGGSGDEFAFGYSPDDADQPLVGIVKAVSWVTGTDPCDLEPLYSVIDVDPLRDLIRSSRRDFYRNSSDAGATDVHVRFTYEGCIVTVTTDTIQVERR